MFICRKSKEMLSKEIDMFEKFLKRLDPKDVQFKGTLHHDTKGAATANRACSHNCTCN